MKIVEPQVELWKQEPTLEGVWNQIARATRVCYQSKPRKGESSEDFVKRIILKPALIKGNLDDLEHCTFDFDKMHGTMLEHGTVYLSFDVDNNPFIVKTLKENKYTKVVEHFASAESVVAEITTNVRVLIENNIINLLNYICKPTNYHTRRYTFSVIQEIEDTYKYLIINNWRPEQARQVLPLGLKTQAVYTAFADDWEHFLRLRADNVSGKVHPNMQLVANKIQDIINIL